MIFLDQAYSKAHFIGNFNAAQAKKYEEICFLFYPEKNSDNVQYNFALKLRNTLGYVDGNVKV